jgi:methylmalonyl-CoA/ethylmalonyl-CoA epimerase
VTGSSDTAFEELKGKGVEFESEPHVVHRTERIELWMTFFTDPDGNHLALMCERNV